MRKLQVGVATDTGRVRVLNEDAVYTGVTLFAVADGMGGHAAGEVASHLVVTALEEMDNREDLTAETVAQFVRDANHRLLSSMSSNPEQLGMGTTLAGLAAVQVGGSAHWMVFNVGDSRVYRFIHGRLSQLTEDHSEVAELVAAGTITERDARNHPRRNVITRSLGSQPAPVADVLVLPVSGPERFVICSDGLNTELDDDSIADVLAATEDVQECADELVRRALHCGGLDNVTVIVVDFAGSQGGAHTSTAPRSAVAQSGGVLGS